jgi:DNA repair exonuclease SbcCD ATPase subunit
MSGEATSGTGMTAKTGESKRGTGDRDLLASIEHLKTLLMSGKAIQNHQPVIETPVAATQAKVRVGLFDLVQQNEEAHKQQQLTAVPESQLNVDGGTVSTFGQKSSVYKIDQLQSEQQEWKQRFEAEKARRESLDKTYKALLGHRKELSTQLETVTKSRRDVEQQLKDLQRQQERRERERTQQDLQRIFAQQKDHEQAAQDQRRRDQERIEHSRWELNNLQLRYNDLQEELRKMNDENKRLNGERDRCHGLEISSLKDEVRRLVQDVESKKTELDQIRRQHKVELEQLRHTNDENMERTIQGRIDLAIQELKTKTRQEQELEKQVHAEADLKEQESSLKNEMIEQQEKVRTCLGVLLFRRSRLIIYFLLSQYLHSLLLTRSLASE